MQLETKGYTLQEAYRKIGGMGKVKMIIYFLYREIPHIFQYHANNGLLVRLFSRATDAVR